MTSRTTAVGLAALFVLAWSLTFAGGYHTVSTISSNDRVVVELDIPEHATPTPVNETTANETTANETTANETPVNETTEKQKRTTEEKKTTEKTETGTANESETNASLSAWTPSFVRSTTGSAGR